MHVTRKARLRPVAPGTRFAARLGGGILPAAIFALALIVVGCSRSADKPADELTPPADALRYTEVTSAVPLPNGDVEAVFAEPRLAVRKVVLTPGEASEQVVLAVSEVEFSRLESVPEVEGEVFQVLDISLDVVAEVEPASLESVKVTFDLPRQWLADANGEPGDVVLQRLVGGEWVPLATSLIAESAARLTFEALSPGLSLFAITVGAEPPPSPTATATTAPELAASPGAEGASPTPPAVEVSLGNEQPTPTAVPSATLTTSPPDSSPTPTPSPVTPSPTPTPTRTPRPATPTAIADPASPTPSPTPTPTPIAPPPEASSPTPVPTLTPTPIAPTPTATPTPAPPTATPFTIRPIPINTPTRVPGPRPTATPTPPPTATAVPPTPTHTATAVPPTPTGTSIPTATPTPLPGDPKFAVAMHARTKAEIGYFLEELGVRWFGVHEERLSEIPDGAETMVWLDLGVDPGNWTAVRAGSIDELSDYEKESYQFHTTARIQNLVGQNLGAAWMIMGEVNRLAGISPATFAVVYRYYYDQIKAADPTALVLGPAALNWDFTCIGCAGYARGHDWIASFVAAYDQIYGTKPPVDIWPLQVYPIDWFYLPNGDTDPANYPFDPTVGFKRPHWQISAAQVEGFRSYLDLSGYADTPIWITETSIHWGFDDRVGLGPAGSNYNPHFMADYMINWIDWLEQNSVTKMIERWFFFTTYKQIGVPVGDGYQGIIFFNNPDVATTQRTCMGDIYRARSLGLADVTCDEGGQTIPYSPP